MGTRTVSLLAILLLAVVGGLAGLPVRIGPAVAEAPGVVHFTAAGDFSSSANAGAVLSSMAAGGSDFSLALGDLSYGSAGQEQTWCDFVKARVGSSYPFELVSGNHESNGLNGSIDAFATCLPNRLPGLSGTYAKQYFVDVPATNPIMRLVMISPGLTYPDGAWSYAKGTSRYQWTSDAIDGARTAGLRWVVVGMHKPCLSVGAYACEAGVDLFNLLVSKRVDLVLTGHEHSYQRTHQLALGASCLSVVPAAYDADCAVDRDSAYVAGAGTVVAVVGTGGNTLYNVNDADVERPYFATVSGANANPTWGPIDVTATSDSLRASFLRSAGGTLADSFTITRSASTTYASDAFSRTVASGWGSAPIGGNWTVTGSVSDYAVGNGSGTLRTPANGSRSGALAAVSTDRSDLRTTVSVDKTATGNGLYLRVQGRRVPGQGSYQARVLLRSSGQLTLDLVRATATESVIQAGITVPGVTYGPNVRLDVRVQVVGTNPTLVQAKVWQTGTAEPAGWQRSVTDSTAALQSSGAVGLSSYLFGNATNGPITVAVDSIEVTAP